ncbi:hypothetical protein [Paracholeplasma manati]|uniref:hypothetical protein n=1 Tax=Paracholeplasma manati TaxID=591373 RepID=UPI002407A99B|nr:hypothetical protein [Paracholeplasma manati]MDG0888496.1 hypothetical protein [Paracholeplasma manati]
MTISKGMYIKRNLILLGCGALMFLTSLGYFLGWKLEMMTLLIYISVIVLECFFAMVAVIILNKMNNKFYRFDVDKTVYLIIKESEQLVLSFNKITKVFYVRFFWTLLMQMGAGYLHIQHKNNDNIIENIYISMSPKDVKRLENIYRIKIEMK